MRKERSKDNLNDERPRLWIVSEDCDPEADYADYNLAMGGGVEIVGASRTIFDNKVRILRTSNKLKFGLSVILSGLGRFKRGDRILVSTAPLGIPFIVAIVSLTKGCAYTLLVQDKYIEISKTAGKWIPGSFATLVISFLNRWLYKHAAGIVVTSRAMRELMKRKTEGLEIPITLLPDFWEPERGREAEITPTPESSPRKNSTVPTLVELGRQQ